MMATALCALASCAVGDGMGTSPDEASSNTPDSDGPLGTAQQGILVSGLGHYCSMTWPTGGWSFVSYTNGGDPCADIQAASDPGGTIRRAGVYSPTGINNVVARCDGGYVNKWSGTGNAPLTSAYNWALGKTGCVFTVSPKAIPIFKSPFLHSAVTGDPGGFDHAWRDDAKLTYTVNISQFNQPPGGAQTIVDWKGRAGGGNNDHDAWDYNMPKLTPIRAVASGAVRKAQYADTGCTGSESPIQGEVYIDTTITRSPSTYNETFTHAYFHLHQIATTDGAWVNQGDVIGYAGNKGCSSESHLHFAVIRLTNTSSDYRRLDPSATFPFFISTTVASSGYVEAVNSGWVSAVDPYGFDPPQGFDPRAYLSYPHGALSINLWKDDVACTQGSSCQSGVCQSGFCLETPPTGN
jgi:murein DD-endopeptidase MepM/ murein hydrolase activator NlpD